MYLKEVNWIVHRNQQAMIFKIHTKFLKGTESVPVRSEFIFTRNCRNLWVSASLQLIQELTLVSSVSERPFKSSVEDKIITKEEWRRADLF